ARPQRAAPDRPIEGNVRAVVPGVTQLEADTGKSGKQSQVPDPPVVIRAEPEHVRRDELAPIQTGEVQEPAEPKLVDDRDVAVERGGEPQRRRWRVAPPRAAIGRLELELVECLVRTGRGGS